MVNPKKRTTGFTLVELLVVVAVIAMLVSIMLPSLDSVKESARSVKCQSNLRNLGLAMRTFLAENKKHFWPYKLENCYFWGTDADPVDPSLSPFMQHCGCNLSVLWCPSLAWGSYLPQGKNVSEPTTTYAYNGHYLDPGLKGETCKSLAEIPQPEQLFVLADAAWEPVDTVLQNSTYLEPVEGSWVQMPTNHFRHNGRTNVLCADGHVAAFGTEGWEIDSPYNLGFVGTENYPHYVQ